MKIPFFLRRIVWCICKYIHTHTCVCVLFPQWLSLMILRDTCPNQVLFETPIRSNQAVAVASWGWWWTSLSISQQNPNRHTGRLNVCPTKRCILVHRLESAPESLACQEPRWTYHVYLYKYVCIYIYTYIYIYILHVISNIHAHTIILDA